MAKRRGRPPSKDKPMFWQPPDDRPARAAFVAPESAEIVVGDDDGAAATIVGDDERRQSVAIPVDKTGKVAIEDLSEKARARLVSMLNDPAVRALGVTPAADAGAVDPAVTGILYDAIGSLASSIAVATGHTVDSAKLLAFTADEKASLAEPTAKVLSKYSGAWAKWQDEIALGMLLTAILQGKVQRLERKPSEGRSFSMVPKPS